MYFSTRVARQIVALRTQTFSDAAYDKAELAILDTLGVTLAGSVHPAIGKLKHVVLDGQRSGAAGIVGSGERASVLDAALINGTAAHMLDFDDSNSQLFGHPSVVVLPALLALAEGRAVSGEDFLRAYLGGFEAATRLGTGISRFHYTHGWHPTSTVGIFGTVAAAALLLELDEAQIAHALGIAASMSAGVKSNFGSMTKPLHVGQAVRNGLQAALLAAEGFTASADAFEHPQGYLKVYNFGPEHYDIETALSGWNQPASILEPGLQQKRFACCYSCLPAVDGILQLREQQGIREEDVEAITVAVHPIRFPHINVPRPDSALEAKFSVHFCVAQALRQGKLTLDDFDGEVFQDAAVRRLMQRVAFATYARENPRGAWVRVQMRNGASHEVFVEKALGAGYDHPLSDEVIRAKFDECARRAIPAEQADALYALLRQLRRLPDVDALLRLLGQPS